MPATPLDLIYRPEAVADLENLFDYIAHDRPLAAERFLGEIRRACEGLRWFPMLGVQLDPDDDRVRAITVRKRAVVKFFVHDDRLHILGVSYRGRDLAVFFAGREP